MARNRGISKLRTINVKIIMLKIAEFRPREGVNTVTDERLRHPKIQPLDDGTSKPTPPRSDPLIPPRGPVPP